MSKMQALIDATRRELEIQKMHRANSVANVVRLMENTDSTHFAHHLASSAQAIAEADGRISQTSRILKSLEDGLDA